MKMLESVIKFLQFEMVKPEMYGIFHIACLVSMVILTIILVKKAKNDKKVLFVMSIIMLLFEVYKQLSFSYNDGVWEYQWYAFPFQFCSVPMYVAFIASLTKNEKFKNALYMFLSTYGLIAGIAVMLYPSTVFIKEVLIDIQTMVHHGFMVVMGLYLILTNKVEFNFKNIKRGCLVFTVVLLVAFVANIATYYLGIDDGLELFYISPYHIPVIPVFDIIYQNVPYIVFLFIYITAFSAGSLIPFGIINLINKKLKKINYLGGLINEKGK